MPVSFIQHRIKSQLLYYHNNRYLNCKNKNRYYYYLILLLLHDIHPNPGPSCSLNIGYTDIRSLFSDTNISVLIEVQDCKFNDMIKEFICINNCDIIFLTETWLKDEEISKYQLHIDGYRFPIYNNRQILGGGLLIYYKENIKIDKIENLQNNNLEHLVVEVVCSNITKFIFNLVCRAPSNDKNIIEHLINNFYDCYNYSLIHNYTGIYFPGDFNFPTINWLNSENNNHSFHDAITHLGLYQLVNEPTRLKNILDVIITDSPGFTTEITINPPIKNCYHNTIIFNINYIDKPIKILPRRIYKYNEGHWDKIRENLSNIDWFGNSYKCTTIEEMVDYLQNKIYSEMDTHIPFFILSHTQRKHPYINSKIKNI